MDCDVCDQQGVKWYLVTRRPSQPAELVATMAVCDEHVDEIGGFDPTNPIKDWDGTGYIIGTRDMFNEFIESAEARRLGLLWLSI